MEGEVGAQVAPPVFIHQPLAGRFHETPVPRKRDFPWQNPGFLNNPTASGAPSPSGANWNPRMWIWDSVRFSAMPSEAPFLGADPSLSYQAEKKKNIADDASNGAAFNRVAQEEGENLTLKLGAGAYTVEEPVVRPNKRVRSGSPGGGGNYPMCQVDDCRADLSGAKDYHRRHKVCEFHSKTTKALVGNQMQRFCQQCSRFHPLSEFDEGKRSCRRRLAGHNRRRRKTQPEDASSRLSLPVTQDKGSKASMEVANLLSVLARLQGTNVDAITNGIYVPEKDTLLHVLSRLSSLNPATKLAVTGGFDLNAAQVSQHGSLEQLQSFEGNSSSSSTRNLLAVLSTTFAAPAPNTLASKSEGNSNHRGNDGDILQHKNPSADVSSQNKSFEMFPSVGARRSCGAVQSTMEIRQPPIQEAPSSLPFQLFGATLDERPAENGSSKKYLSSESTNPTEERSPSCSPPVAQKLFPLWSGAEGMNHELMACSREENLAVESSTCHGWKKPLELFKEPDRRVEGGAVQRKPYPVSCTSSSGSDHSPSSSNSDSRDRTGRIIFKLFDKDPSSLPGSIRSEIFNWLSASPSEMESYIRPGCVVLAIYVLMPSIAWDELESDLYQRVHSLLQSSDSEFWRGRFLVRTSKQLVSHKDGNIRLCKSWKTWSAPELISVSPIAIVSGQETSLVLRGRNLRVPGTKIHCTFMGGYTSKQVMASAYPHVIYDDSSFESFSFSWRSPNMLGRCFIEVENGFKGNSFPVIIADASICQELRALESAIEERMVAEEVIQGDRVQDCGQLRSWEDILHFLNELGWLFQRQSSPSSIALSDFSTRRFKFLLTFSVERDWPALIRTLLDMLVERSSKSRDFVQESLEMLSEVQLLSRAVKRKCRRMVDLLLHYSVAGGVDAPKLYLFLPTMAGPGGLTPLHVAACTHDSEDIVDALTNDPQEIGLSCWNSVQDDNGQLPSNYASARNYDSYNTLVARKLADRRNSQVSITVQTEHACSDKPFSIGKANKLVARPLYARSCAQCVFINANCIKPRAKSRGLLQRPYIHSMLAVAAVCVCVCLFARGSPDLGLVAPFSWEKLDFGPR